MTDSHHSPSAPSAANSPDYEGSDRDLPESKKPGVSTVQVGASAAAAVTSALAASFFGVAGTLIGAAVGSIVSTIAGALYAEYLGRAGKRIAVTRDVVIQRIPSEVLATTPLRRLTNPSDLPGRESLRPIGDENGDETVIVPVEDATELLRRPDGMAPLDQTTVIPAYGSAAAETAMQAAATNGSTTGSSRPAPSARPASTRLPSARPPVDPRPWWKKPAFVMAGISLAGFLIALGVVLAIEAGLGHPVSGGDSGTTFSNIGSNTSSTTAPEVTPSATATPSASATTATPSATTAAPTATATATAPATVAPTATSAPTTAPVAPEATAEATATGQTQETAAP